jgi:hypothetical protein
LGALWVSDVHAGKVFRIVLDGKVTIVADVPSRPFGLGFLPDGDLLVASTTQRLILKFGAETPAVHADMAAFASGYLRDLAVARRACLRTRLLGIGTDSSGNAGWQYSIGCRQHRASERVGYPNRQQTARVEITTVDVPGAASSIRLAEIGSH